MNHYMMARRTEELPSPRFGDVAIHQLLDGMTRLGCSVASLRAKIFGGAEVLPFGAGGDTVGSQNAQIALELLGRHRIPILTRCTGGRFGILIRLYTETGDVLVQPLPVAHPVGTHRTAEAGLPFSA